MARTIQILQGLKAHLPTLEAGEMAYTLDSKELFIGGQPGDGNIDITRYLQFGDLSNLTTEVKSSLVAAINELDGEIGDLSTLQTTDKTKLVNAINENTQQLAETETEIEQERTSVFSRTTFQTGQKAVVFIDDDGYKEVLTRLKPIADEKGFKFTSAVVTGWANNKDPRVMTWDDIKQLKAEGHDIVSHSVTHTQLATISLEEANKELRDSKKHFREQGIDVEHFVYPGGSRNRDVENLARKYYKSGVSINGTVNYIPLDQYNVRRPWFDTNDNTAMKAEVDKLVTSTKGGLLVFMLHVWMEQWNDGTKEQQLRELVDYIYSNGLEIKTYTEAFGNFGNIIDIGSTLDAGYFKIDPSGNVHSPNFSSVKRYPLNSLSFDTPPSFFGAQNDVHMTSFNTNSGQTNFPDSSAGLLVAYSSEATTLREYWYPYNSNNIYTRRRASSSTWTPFVRQNPDVDPKSIIGKYTLDFGTIPAHSTKDIIVSIAGVQYGRDIAEVNPRFSLGSGLMWCALINGNSEVVVRLSNISNADITVPSTQSFMIKVSVGTVTY